ncbi:MAG: Holliday junction resolvase RecU [Anaerofustis stercorihominis]|nr:Holliday junction resolvase RecU [Anaerofustis stercorihominis]
MRRGLRGSGFEEMINITNAAYYDDDLAVIQKIPTSITPVELDSEKRVISLAYFDRKSTVDYLGNVQGIPVCFDAKETQQKSLPVANIHEHQISFMEKFRNQGGLSFMLVHFLTEDRTFILEFTTIKKYWDDAKNGGRKSIPLSAFNEDLEVFFNLRYPVHYLDSLNIYLETEQRRGDCP